jgi:rifampicin phosphotransferase
MPFSCRGPHRRSVEPPTPVIALDHPSAFDVARVGRKAATLAVARAAGLPVGSGVVLTVDWSRDHIGAAHQVWRIISQDGARPLVVRRSSIDRGNRAGRPLGDVGVVRTVAGAPEFTAAIEAVHDSRTAVLVQPFAEAIWRGVMFADAGRRPRPVVACASAAYPQRVWMAEIDQHGRTRRVLSEDVDEQPPAELLGDLARLTRRVDRTFEGHHDVDWVAKRDGSTRLIDIRPGLPAAPAEGVAPALDATTGSQGETGPASIALTLALRSAVTLAQQ